MSGVVPLCFAVALVDCAKRDGDADVSLQGNFDSAGVAVGAYARIAIGDACLGGGKLNLCSSETLVSVDRLEARDADVAVVLPRESVPDGPSSADYYVLGVGSGTTTIDFEGTFDDGSERSASFEVTVRPVNGARVVAGCGVDESTQALALPGTMSSFAVELLHDGRLLTGWHPDAIDPIEGVEEIFGGTDASGFRWSAPAEIGSIPVRSPLVNRQIGTLRVFGPADITNATVELLNGTPAVGQTGDRMVQGIKMEVDGHEPCEVPVGVLRTDTPEVCSGPEGALTWPAENQNFGRITINGEGVCRLRASADGVRFFAQTAVTIFIVTPQAEIIGFSNPCDVEGSSLCTFGETSTVAVCKDGRWTHGATCGPTRMCDARDPSESGCVPGGPCSGCRSLPVASGETPGPPADSAWFEAVAFGWRGRSAAQHARAIDQGGGLLGAPCHAVARLIALGEDETRLR